MSELLLDSLEIKGYRCFENLMIKKLGRVNLVVGKNNVGKTALLEALWILANRGDREILEEILHKRNELPYSSDFYDTTKNQESVGYLFFGRPKFDDSVESPFFSIGLISNSDLYIKVKRTSYFSTVTTYKILFRPQAYFVHTNGLEDSEIIKFWDKTALTEKQKYVLDSLRIMLDKIIAIDLLIYPEGASNRIPVARTSDSQDRMPLKSLGEGMSRIFGIILALVNCKDGIIIIDEIESGLHYSVLSDVWKLIFKIAKDLNIQVFATTHSYDCIDAFAQVAIDDESSDGMLIRLARQDEKIKAFTFDEKQLETIAKEKIEVR